MGKSLIIPGADFSKNGLAPKFVRVSAIYNAGTESQMIQADVLVSKDTKIITTLKVYEESTDNNYVSNVGIFVAGAGNAFVISCSNVAYKCMYNGVSATSKSADTSVFHTIELSLAEGFVFDGVKVGDVNNDPWKFDSTLRLYLNGTSAKPKARLSGITEFYEGDTLIARYIPMIRSADNMAGYYNEVTGVFCVGTESAEYI